MNFLSPRLRDLLTPPQRARALSLLAYIRNTLSAERAWHSLRVGRVAAAWSARRGRQPQAVQMFLAGLMHDVTKEMPHGAHLRLYEMWRAGELRYTDANGQTVELPANLPLLAANASELSHLPKAAWHSQTAALEIARVMRYYDRDITYWIARHTMGDPDMDEPSTVFFAADYLASVFARREWRPYWRTVSQFIGDATPYQIAAEKAAGNIQAALARKKPLDREMVVLYNCLRSAAAPHPPQ